MKRETEDRILSVWAAIVNFLCVATFALFMIAIVGGILGGAVGAWQMRSSGEGYPAWGEWIAIGALGSFLVLGLGMWLWMNIVKIFWGIVSWGTILVVSIVAAISTSWSIQSLQIADRTIAEFYGFLVLCAAPFAVGYLLRPALRRFGAIEWINE